ncbi:MAG: HEPN domain-containing protein [Nitrososphaerota archaeon]
MAKRKEEYETLKRRAIDFYEEAKTALEAGRSDLACFLAEQSAQLHLKSALLRVVGDYSRTHRLRQLLSELVKSTASERLKRFSEEYNVHLSSLEDAYIMARYITKYYTLRDAEESIQLVEALSRIVEEEVRSE